MKCKICKNESERLTRGLCPNDYMQALNRVRAGKLTWKELEKQGKATPKKYTSFEEKINDNR